MVYKQFIFFFAGHLQAKFMNRTQLLQYFFLNNSHLNINIYKITHFMVVVVFLVCKTNIWKSTQLNVCFCVQSAWDNWKCFRLDHSTMFMSSAASHLRMLDRFQVSKTANIYNGQVVYNWDYNRHVFLRLLFRFAITLVMHCRRQNIGCKHTWGWHVRLPQSILFILEFQVRA